MAPNENAKPKLILICGPTAIGKTSVAIDTARFLDGEVVNADSMQIYRHMDIGTAKPTADERRRAVHHMIDIAMPDEPYDAARFSTEARASVNHVLSRGRIPIVSGGTGFYIRALLYGLCDAAPEDAAIRSRLKAEARQSGADVLYRRLEACDPEAAGKIHPNDTYRVIRALEVFAASGMTISEYRRRHGFSDAPYNVLKIGLFMDRAVLYERIDRRVDQMMAEGFCDEVRRLLEMGCHDNLRPMQALGYRHLAAYLAGKTDLETAVATMKRDTRHYAKRQLTWFRKDPETHWFEPDRTASMIAFAKKFTG